MLFIAVLVEPYGTLTETSLFAGIISPYLSSCNLQTPLDLHGFVSGKKAVTGQGQEKRCFGKKLVDGGGRGYSHSKFEENVGGGGSVMSCPYFQ